jgi:hypothetical protein
LVVRVGEKGPACNLPEAAALDRRLDQTRVAELEERNGRRAPALLREGEIDQLNDVLNQAGVRMEEYTSTSALFRSWKSRKTIGPDKTSWRLV